MTDAQRQRQEPKKHAAITPRRGLDFQLDDPDIPRHWLGADPFRTRFFDALSVIFPAGERFFIESVRRCAGAGAGSIPDIGEFIDQEAQHSRVHARFNDRLRAQGVEVDHMDRREREKMATLLARLPPQFTLAATAGVEHLTAAMSRSFLAQPSLFREADPRVRAMFFWHAIEELEHRAVAFTLIGACGVRGWLLRSGAFLLGMLDITITVWRIVAEMLAVDGYRGPARLMIMARGALWLYGPRGVITVMLPDLLRYLRPGFHPEEPGTEAPEADHWREAFARSGDPIEAAVPLITGTAAGC